ncbi:hypothetical protein RN001_011955 [Aquatica leii]|uniref:Uncharacterized protein n=1 Tax=Aquatica leii TaxID=1421715 RepID=A0AAN7SM90_9COLE|nr:hypothetical protein RN001_011955 [Aquatica leii]
MSEEEVDDLTPEQLELATIILEKEHECNLTLNVSSELQEDLETGERETSELPDNLLKDLEKIHSINGVSSGGLHLKDYSAKKETRRYVTVSVGDKISIIRKSSLCWLLDQGKNRSVPI